MQKVALVVLVLALALLGVFVFLMSKGKADPGGRGDSVATAKKSGGSASDAELARLRAEVESLRKQMEAQKKRAETAEEKLAGAGSDEVSVAAARSEERRVGKECRL